MVVIRYNTAVARGDEYKIYHKQKLCTKPKQCIQLKKTKTKKNNTVISLKIWTTVFSLCAGHFWNKRNPTHSSLTHRLETVQNNYQPIPEIQSDAKQGHLCRLCHQQQTRVTSVQDF